MIILLAVVLIYESFYIFHHKQDISNHNCSFLLFNENALVLPSCISDKTRVPQSKVFSTIKPLLLDYSYTYATSKIFRMHRMAIQVRFLSHASQFLLLLPFPHISLTPFQVNMPKVLAVNRLYTS